MMLISKRILALFFWGSGTIEYDMFHSPERTQALSLQTQQNINRKYVRKFAYSIEG